MEPLEPLDTDLVMVGKGGGLSLGEDKAREARDEHRLSIQLTDECVE